MHPSFHSSNVHHSQTVEGAEMPFNRQMDKEEAIRKDEYPFALTWMELKGIMLSEIRQRKTNIWFHLYVEHKE